MKPMKRMISARLSLFTLDIAEIISDKTKKNRTHVMESGVAALGWLMTHVSRDCPKCVQCVILQASLRMEDEEYIAFRGRLLSEWPARLLGDQDVLMNSSSHGAEGMASSVKKEVEDE